MVKFEPGRGWIYQHRPAEGRPEGPLARPWRRNGAFGLPSAGPDVKSAALVPARSSHRRGHAQTYSRYCAGTTPSAFHSSRGSFMSVISPRRMSSTQPWILG